MTKLTVLLTVSILLLANVRPSKGIGLPRLCWTNWFSRYVPGVGDLDDLRDLRAENPDRICIQPLDIQAVTVDGNVPAENTGQRFYAYNTVKGFICLNKDQVSGVCFNYKVRFRCPCLS
ncbi:cartilage intermediate layer protein 2 [Nothobranchius furzeri]|uniref:cartilage intermediate layer protein 2 n=1 Tax=Nothobranchius furzeri TaxID=105023 RepID=UPI002403FD5E|nr:cartilage intermediate layer protein 2-like [Nothobranchius furzeri]